MSNAEPCYRCDPDFGFCVCGADDVAELDHAPAPEVDDGDLTGDDLYYWPA